MNTGVRPRHTRRAWTAGWQTAGWRPWRRWLARPARHRLADLGPCAVGPRRGSERRSQDAPRSRSATQATPIGRASRTCTAPEAPIGTASAGSRNQPMLRINRASASRSTWSARPKLGMIRALGIPVSGSRSLGPAPGTRPRCHLGSAVASPASTCLRHYCSGSPDSSTSGLGVCLRLPAPRTARNARTSTNILRRRSIYLHSAELRTNLCGQYT